MRLQQSLAGRRPQLIDKRVRLVSKCFKEKFSRQRISVRMQARGRQSQQYVTGRDRFSINHLFTIDHADDKARDVVFTIGINTRPLCRLTAEQYAAIITTADGNSVDD